MDVKKKLPKHVCENHPVATRCAKGNLSKCSSWSNFPQNCDVGCENHCNHRPIGKNIKLKQKNAFDYFLRYVSAYVKVKISRCPGD